MKYYIYKLYFLSGATYIGQHTEKFENDNYVSSSSYMTQHPEDPIIKRDILIEVKDKETLDIMETLCIRADKADNPKNVNKNYGNWDYRFCFKGFHHSQESIQKMVASRKKNPEYGKSISKALKGKKKSEEHKKALSQSWHKSESYYKERCEKIKGNTNRKTEEEKAYISKILKERFKNKENHPMFGKHLTNETKQKISKSNKGKMPWNKGAKNPGIGGHKKGYIKSESEIQKMKQSSQRVLIDENNNIICEGNENIIKFFGDLFVERSVKAFLKNHPELKYKCITKSQYSKL